MFLFVQHNNEWHFAAIWKLSLLIITINSVCSQQIFQSLIVVSTPGTRFVPVNEPAQLLSKIFTDSFAACTTACNNNPPCRVFDYSVAAPGECRMFEGDTTTVGSIVSSSSSQSLAGAVQLSVDLFVAYGLPCSIHCYQSRYLICGSDSMCQCMPHTYWDKSISMCIPQLPVLGAPCQSNMNMCREDLNYTCLPINKCGCKLHRYRSL
jgi:hypothetical protein